MYINPSGYAGRKMAHNTSTTRHSLARLSITGNVSTLNASLLIFITATLSSNREANLLRWVNRRMAFSSDAFRYSAYLIGAICKAQMIAAEIEFKLDYK